jgi:AbrB family looped-hinge helix DNA binding protein
MEEPVTTVTISPKYQIVIPKDIRKSMGLKPGEKARMIPYEHRIEVIPERHIKKMRGFLRGIDTTVNREQDRV